MNKWMARRRRKSGDKGPTQARGIEKGRKERKKLSSIRSGWLKSAKISQGRKRDLGMAFFLTVPARMNQTAATNIAEEKCDAVRCQRPDYLRICSLLEQRHYKYSISFFRNSFFIAEIKLVRQLLLSSQTYFFYTFSYNQGSKIYSQVKFHITIQVNGNGDIIARQVKGASRATSYKLRQGRSTHCNASLWQASFLWCPHRVRGSSTTTHHW